MFCPRCGNSYNNGAKFCSKCGNVLSQPDANQSMRPVSGNQSGVPPVYGAPEPNDKDNKELKLTLLIIGIVLILLVLIGGIVLALTSYDGSAKTQKKVEEQIEDEDAEDTYDEEIEEYTEDKEDINIEIRQFDNAEFPNMTLYASITDLNGETIESLDKNDFLIQEIMENGKTVDVSLDKVYRVLDTDHISINMVFDASGSMSDYDKMYQAQNAAKSFIRQMDLSNGDQVEIISFDDYVYLEQEFTSQAKLAIEAIDNIQPGDNTALYDALYSGLLQTHYEEGPKCVIGFTDGMENASNYTYDDVAEMARTTGIPVYIIGIGEEYDAYVYQNLAYECSGNYYSANTDDLQSILEDIYMSIYREQKDYYVFRYTTSDEGDLTDFREVVLQTSDSAGYNGSCTRSYVPVTDISGAFSASYMDKDFMLDFSSHREVTQSDLYGMSLAELRIARNEIFARHGRQFKDAFLNQWFYSKVWYLNLPCKYAPDYFDGTNPDPLSELELRNANFIKEYEDNIMKTQDIFPDASNVLLSEYDLALSKPVLSKALEQLQYYPSTSVLEDNKIFIQGAIQREDVRY